MKHIHFTLKNSFLKVILLLCIIFYFDASSIFPQNTLNTEKVLKTVADEILKDATFDFVDVKTGKHFNAAKEASDNITLQPESPYNDWRYWNGVLNIALLKLGEEFNESAYSEFSIKNIAFTFEGVCAGTGVSDNLIHYYKRPTPLNDIHGIGAVLLAGSEILNSLKD